MAQGIDSVSNVVNIYNYRIGFAGRRPAPPGTPPRPPHRHHLAWLPRTLKKLPNLSPDAFVASLPIFDTMSLGSLPTLPSSCAAASPDSNRGYTTGKKGLRRSTC